MRGPVLCVFSRFLRSAFAPGACRAAERVTKEKLHCFVRLALLRRSFRAFSLRRRSCQVSPRHQKKLAGRSFSSPLRAPPSFFWAAFQSTTVFLCALGEERQRLKYDALAASRRCAPRFPLPVRRTHANAFALSFSFRRIACISSSPGTGDGCDSVR